MRFLLRYAMVLLALALASSVFSDDGSRLLRLDHYVEVHSAVPAIAGQTTQIYVREVAGANDKQVSPEHVRELYTDMGSPKRVFIDLACSSHNAMWEKNHLLLFQASLEWLTQGSVEGKQEGMLRLGY